MPSADFERPSRPDVERIGDRDLADWPTTVGRFAVSMLTHLAHFVGRVLRWSVSNAALVITAGVGLLLVWAFTSITGEVYEDVADRDGIAAIDQPVLDRSVQWRTPQLERWATAFTDLGGEIGMPIIAVVVAVGLGVQWRRWTPIVLMVIATAGSLLITITGKELTGRARPPLSLAVPPYESSPSFPSGHTLNATVVLGLTAYLLVLWLSKKRWRTLVMLGLGLFVVAMGLSRVFLGHHWLTDVVAGWAVGLGWLAAVITGHRIKITLDRASGQGQAPDTTSISQGPTKPSAPSN